jgi:hypothetical protein
MADLREPDQRRQGDSEVSHQTEEPPPILGTWPRIYAVVIGWIVILISLFYWFTKTWNR